MQTSELLKKVRTIELKTRGITNHIFAGEYHSAFKGRGMSFSEVREYQYGDDIRNIDWNVTARYQTPFVKQYEEERELTLMLMVDVSASDHFGTTHQFKSDVLTEICAVLAFSAIKNNDKVGLMLFSSEVELFIPPKKGKPHILRIIRELIDFSPKHTGTDVGKALEYINHVVKKRSIVFLMSDFLSGDFQRPLRVTGRKHDLTGLHIYDQSERELPNVGLARLLDPETGKRKWVNTSSRQVRKAFNEYFRKNTESVRDKFRRSGSDFISINTKESYIKALRSFFNQREKRR